MYNLISQNCLCGDIYKNNLKIDYQNPFVWCVITFENMYNLISKWDNINFLNYELKKDKNWNFSLNIDNKVNIQYVHYKFSYNDSTIRKNGVDVFYNKIWEYIIEIYEKRIQKMLNNKENPLFCICNFDTIYKDAIYTKEQLQILSKFNNVKILRGCEKMSPSAAADLFYKTFLIK